MQNNILIFATVLLMTNSLKLHGQYTTEVTKIKRCFVGTTPFILFNLDSNERPDFYQLNLGYRLTQKDVLTVEFKTWRYFEPLGIPYGKSRNESNENFPGYIREKGFAIAYQRFWWKGLYTGIDVMNAWQNFIDENEDKIDNGFQIFNTYRIGYHIKLFKSSFFIEPSIAITHRPYHTKMPDSFKQIDDKWSKYFYGEPGLHIGFNF